MRFEELDTTKLGEYCEDILINEFITSKGYVPYRPSMKGPHAVDAVAKKRGKKDWNLEIKAKRSLLYYSGTSIDANDYQSYLNEQDPVYLLFADAQTKTVYGGWVHKLPVMKIEAIDEHKFTTFYLSGMTYYRDLNEVELATIKSYEQSKYYQTNTH